MMRGLFIISFFVLITSCEKEVLITDETEFDLEINRDEFSDTIYWINNLNVTSTNDSVIYNATFQLMDDESNLIFEDSWQNARNFSFDLEERRKYKLDAILFLNAGDTLFEAEVEIDNNDYPDAIKFNSITMNSSVLNNDGTYYVSNSHTTSIRVYHALDAIYNSDNYDVEVATVFYQKQFAPKQTTFNFSNFELPTRSIERNWRHYEVRVGYPIVVGASGSTVVNDREVIFYLDLQDLIKNGNSSSGIPFYYTSNDSSEGGIYSGTIEYEWIYEN